MLHSKNILLNHLNRNFHKVYKLSDFSDEVQYLTKPQAKLYFFLYLSAPSVNKSSSFNRSSTKLQKGTSFDAARYVTSCDMFS